MNTKRVAETRRRPRLRRNTRHGLFCCGRDDSGTERRRERRLTDLDQAR
jgi:hypothetical protein